GPTVSIDARLLMIEKDITESFFAAAENQALVIGAVDRLATEVSGVISGEGGRVFRKEESSPPPTSSKPSPEADDQSIHPDRIFKTPVIVPPPVAVPLEIPAAPPLPTASLPGSARGPAATRSQFLDMEIQVIDVGDLFGDGGEQIVIAEKRKITVFRRDNGQLQKVGGVPEAPRHVRIIALNLADLNNNGRAEIYISAVSDNSPYSYAAEWDGRQFVKTFDRRPHYLRPLFVPGKGWGLYGQQAGFDGPARPGIYKADPESGSLDTGDKLDISGSANLYEFVLGDFTGDGRLETVVQTQKGELLIHNGGGDLLWRSSGDYGYTKRFIGEPYSGAGDHENLQVGTRLVAEDLNGDGRAELVAMENPSGVAALLKTVGSFIGGSIKVLTWDGVGFTELWSTGEIGSYVASFQVEGARLHLGLVAEKSGGLFTGLHSFMASYGLPGPAGE
ncbi:MAG: VCBS repeat-containing protein, partial [Desulfurivibrionaceae bacterium]|nr:VCBS repeat-containing protein [Desulfurivibrionaceae bacterium]